MVISALSVLHSSFFFSACIWNRHVFADTLTTLNLSPINTSSLPIFAACLIYDCFLPFNSDNNQQYDITQSIYTYGCIAFYLLRIPHFSTFFPLIFPLFNPLPCFSPSMPHSSCCRHRCHFPFLGQLTHHAPRGFIYLITNMTIGFK